MKKSLLIILACVFSAIALQAQTTGGPDAYGYKWRNSNDPNNASYLWTFGDGDSSTLANPDHKFASPGTYTVCLMQTNLVSRCSDTYCFDVVVIDTASGCGSLFHARPTGANPDSIDFINTSVGGLDYLWTFGDGDSSIAPSPAHLYASPGLYNVCLTITDTNTLCSSTYCYDVIAPDVKNGCYANFYANPVVVPDSFHFVNLSVERVVYNWIDIVNIPFSNEVKLLSDDNTVGPFQVGFNFHYYWYDDSMFYIGSNGYISFKNGQASSPFSPIPIAGKLDDFLAGMVGDLNFISTDINVTNPAKCWHYQTPTGDSLIVTYDSVPYWTNQNTWSFQGFNSFQIILSNLDSSITMQYKMVTDSAYTAVGLPGGYLVTGIESKAGSIGLQHMFNVFPDNNLAVKYYYPISTSYVVKDAAPYWADNDISGGRFVSKDGSGQQLKALIKKQGNQTVNPFNVTANIVTPANQFVVTNTVATDTLLANQGQLMTYNNSWFPNVVGTHKFQVSTFLPGDIVGGNDLQEVELVSVDTTTANQWLSFDNGVVGANPLSWLGGNGGAAVQFIPPFYPCSLNSLRYYIVNNTGTTGNPEGFIAMVFDDHGFQGAPLFMLDSQFVDPFNVLPNSWNTVTLTNPLIIDSGSVYVVWYMGGDGIQLGTNYAKPISHRTFEILGNSFASYRDRDTADLMININISKVSTIGINENEEQAIFSNIYPNPSRDNALIDYSFVASIESVTLSIFDLQGKLVNSKEIPVTKNKGNISFPVNQLQQGIYTCKLKAGDVEVARKLTVVK